MSESVSWLESAPAGESEDENRAKGGYLSAQGRRAAIAGAISVVGRYFLTGSSPLTTQTALDRGQPATSTDDPLVAALRFRHLLALTDTLILLLEQISGRPTFRYLLSEAESIGQVTGALDMGRYVQSRQPARSGPPVFPILEATRTSATPENTLATFAAMWVVDETRSSASRAAAPAQSPESMRATDLRQRVARLLTRPAFSSSTSRARDVLRRGTIDALLHQVEGRLRRGEVATPDPYLALYRLVTDLRNHGPNAESGAAPWSFYGESFDQRLFELWCLQGIGCAISQALDVPAPVPLGTSGCVYRWDRPAGTLEVHFQRSVSTVVPTRHARWRQVSGEAIRGIPDFVVTATERASSEVRIAIFDAKLRQRSGAPTDELYKILGYFQNFGLDTAPVGGIFTYGPTHDVPEVLRFEDAQSQGTLLATVLNPAVSGQTQEGMRSVAAAVLGLLSIPPLSSDESGSDPEALEEVVVQHRLHELRAVAQTMPPQSLDPSRRRVAGQIGEDRWRVLSDDSQTMLATAEHVGFLLSDEADHSGPVLGLIAPMEVLLFERFVEPAVAANPEIPSLRKVTLGQALHMLGQRGPGGDPRTQAVLRVVGASALDPQLLTVVVNELRDLNATHRIPAAHREALDRDAWQACYRRVLSEDLLARVIDLLA